jgi:glutathione synthase/RimK-type ligase-like ATP-grasp enzyme
MLQPFLGEIVSEGELSFIFIDGIFCHAVQKTPAAGDFRVQEGFGGKVAPFSADDELAKKALRALDAVKEPWLYARVDAVRSGEGLLVTEIELLEPSLYFLQHPPTAARMAVALQKRL